jgi:hypothetical protein
VRGNRGSLARVLSCVEEYVGERGANLPWRAEGVVVIAAVENRTPPVKDPIHGPREARGRALHPVRQGRGALRFDEQMDVVVLERVVDDAEVPAFRDCAERALHFGGCVRRRSNAFETTERRERDGYCRTIEPGIGALTPTLKTFFNKVGTASACRISAPRQLPGAPTTTRPSCTRSSGRFEKAKGR